MLPTPQDVLDSFAFYWTDSGKQEAEVIAMPHLREGDPARQAALARREALREALAHFGIGFDTLYDGDNTYFSFTNAVAEDDEDEPQRHLDRLKERVQIAERPKEAVMPYAIMINTTIGRSC